MLRLPRTLVSYVCCGQVIEEIVHLLSGRHGRNTLWQLRRAHQPRRVLLDPLLPHAEAEKRPQTRQLARNGCTLAFLVVKPRNKLADHPVVDFCQWQRRFLRRRQELTKLLEIQPVRAYGVRRSVAFKLLVADKKSDFAFHGPILETVKL